VGVGLKRGGRWTDGLGKGGFIKAESYALRPIERDARGVFHKVGCGTGLQKKLSLRPEKRTGASFQSIHPSRSEKQSSLQESNGLE